MYPTFNRVIPSDSVLTDALSNICKALSWNSIAIIAMDDSFGRGFAQDLIGKTSQLGISVDAYQLYPIGDTSAIANAVRAVKNAGTKIVICLAFEADIENIAVAANKEGIGGRGYVWITGDSIQDLNSLVAGSSEPNLATYLTGWLSVSLAAFSEERRAMFEQTLASVPLEALQNPLFTATAAHTQACAPSSGPRYAWQRLCLSGRVFMYLCLCMPLYFGVYVASQSICCRRLCLCMCFVCLRMCLFCGYFSCVC